MKSSLGHKHALFCYRLSLDVCALTASISSLIGSLTLVNLDPGIEGATGLRTAPPGRKQGAPTICSAANTAMVHRRSAR